MPKLWSYSLTYTILIILFDRTTGPRLADSQSRDLNNEFWLAVYLIFPNSEFVEDLGAVDSAEKSSIVSMHEAEEGKYIPFYFTP